MSNTETPEYNEELLDYLQLFRGEGFLSPGGAEETRRVLDHVEIAGKDVLEVGSGLGGCCLIIAGEQDAKSVHGIDVEPLVISRAKQLVLQAGLKDRISFQHVAPGPLAVSSSSFDVVFSKDAFCHIKDKLIEMTHRDLRRKKQAFSPLHRYGSPNPEDRFNTGLNANM